MLQNLRIVPSIVLSALFLLVTAHQTPAAAQTANPHLNGIPAAPSCNTGHGGQNCKQHQNLQLCLKGTPGTKGRHWICLYNRGKKWVPAGGGTKARAEQALAWEKQNASAPPPPPAAPLTAAPHMPPAGAPGTPPGAAQTGNPHLGGIPAAASCAGSDCSQNPNRQLCLKGTPGAERKHKICMYERGHRWVPAGGGTKARADRALSWEQQNASAPPPPPAAPPTAAPHMPPGAPSGPPPGAPPTAAAQTGNPHLNGIPAAASCGGWDCSQNPNRQLCLKGTSGAKREHYICMHERDNKWIAAAGGTKTRADRALAWEQQNASAPPPPPAAPPTAAPPTAAIPQSEQLVRSGQQYTTDALNILIETECREKLEAECEATTPKMQTKVDGGCYTTTVNYCYMRGMKGCNNNNDGTFSVVNSSTHEVPLYSHYKETAGCKCIKYENFGGTETCMMRAQCGSAMDENGLKPYQKDARHSFKMCLADKRDSLRKICPAGFPCNFPDKSKVPGSPGLRQDHEGTQFRYEGRTNGGPPDPNRRTADPYSDQIMIYDNNGNHKGARRCQLRGTQPCPNCPSGITAAEYDVRKPWLTGCRDQNGAVCGPEHDRSLCQ